MKLLTHSLATGAKCPSHFQNEKWRHTNWSTSASLRNFAALGPD